MSSDDCFELGRQSYVNRDYYHTVLWMNEAMTRMLEEPHNQTQTFTRADVLEYLAFSTYKQGESYTDVPRCLRYNLVGVSRCVYRCVCLSCLLLFLATPCAPSWHATESPLDVLTGSTKCSTLLVNCHLAAGNCTLHWRPTWGTLLVPFWPGESSCQAALGRLSAAR